MSTWFLSYLGLLFAVKKLSSATSAALQQLAAHVVTSNIAPSEISMLKALKETFQLQTT